MFFLLELTIVFLVYALEKADMVADVTLYGLCYYFLGIDFWLDAIVCINVFFEADFCNEVAVVYLGPDPPPTLLLCSCFIGTGLSKTFSIIPLFLNADELPYAPTLLRFFLSIGVTKDALLSLIKPVRFLLISYC